LGWDIQEKKLSDELWNTYFLLLFRQEQIEFERNKVLAELVSMLINPITFKEYYYKMREETRDKDTENVSIKFGDLKKGFGKGFMDEKTGAEISLKKLEQYMTEHS